MKTVLLLGAALLLALLGWAVIANQFLNQKEGTELVELWDRTDPLLVNPDTPELFGLLHIDSHPFESFRFRGQTLSNYQSNVVYSASLPSAFAALSNPYARGVAIDSFKHKMISCLAAMNQEPIGLPRSSIYVPLIRELNLISESLIKNKIAVLHSDLQENNTTLFSIYDSHDRQLLVSHPEQVQKKFEDYIKPGNLHGVTVYIVFKPRNDTDNDYFILMSGLFKRILKKAGATVYVVSNIVVENS